jgi:hypothetical protein
MLYDRREWAKHVQAHEPEMADFLKEMNGLFDARVVKMETDCPECEWGHGEAWTADRAVAPYLKPELCVKGKEKTYKKRQNVTGKYLENLK